MANSNVQGQSVDIFSPYRSIQVESLQSAAMLRYEWNSSETKSTNRNDRSKVEDSTLVDYYERALAVSKLLHDKANAASLGNIVLKYVVVLMEP